MCYNTDGLVNTNAENYAQRIDNCSDQRRRGILCRRLTLLMRNSWLDPAHLLVRPIMAICEPFFPEILLKLDVRLPMIHDNDYLPKRHYQENTSE